MPVNPAFFFVEIEIIGARLVGDLIKKLSKG
jgi:hypothetical protein